jgi:hypothetical protein
MTIEVLHPLWRAAIPHEWDDFEAKFPGDEIFSNWAGRKIGAIAGTLLRSENTIVLGMFKSMVAVNMAKVVPEHVPLDEAK